MCAAILDTSLPTPDKAGRGLETRAVLGMTLTPTGAIAIFKLGSVSGAYDPQWVR
jgi:hypothetical protein